MVLHRISISLFSKFSQRFPKKWFHCFYFLIFWHKENCLYYLGESTYEKYTSFVSSTRTLYYEKEYLQEIAKIYDDSFLQALYKWVPLSFILSILVKKFHIMSLRDIIRINIFRKYIVILRDWLTPPHSPNF